MATNTTKQMRTMYSARATANVGGFVKGYVFVSVVTAELRTQYVRDVLALHPALVGNFELFEQQVRAR